MIQIGSLQLLTHNPYWKDPKTATAVLKREKEMDPSVLLPSFSISGSVTTLSRCLLSVVPLSTSCCSFAIPTEKRRSGFLNLAVIVVYLIHNSKSVSTSVGVFYSPEGIRFARAAERVAGDMRKSKCPYE